MFSDRDAVALLERMVRTSSVSGDEKAIGELLVDAMSAMGFDAHVDEAGNSVGRIGAGGDLGVLLGHMDTVAGHIPVRIENGILHGRGAVDAKAPLAAFIIAAARVHGRDALPGRCVVVGCVEEEAPSSAGAHHVVHRLAPDWCIIGEPSGWDGVTLGYKGCLRVRVRFTQGRGHNAHDRLTACERAVDAWHRVRTSADAYNDERPRLFDQIMPNLVAMDGGVTDTDEYAELDIDMRLPPALGPDDAVEWLRGRVEPGTIRRSGSVPAWSGPRTTELHRALARGIVAEGGRPTWKLKTGTADLNIVAPAWGCPALAYGPGDAALDHTPHEHIELEEYLRGIRVLEHTLQRLHANAKTGSTVGRTAPGRSTP